MICKTCKQERHYCFNCGVEGWYYDYCSLEYLKKDNKIVCPKCYRWAPPCPRDDSLEDDDNNYCPGYVEKQ